MEIAHRLVASTALAGGAGIVLSVTRIALNKLSGGKIRKLDSQNEKLTERLEFWLNEREDSRVVLRILLLLNLLPFLIAVDAWQEICETQQKTASLHWIAPSIALFLFFAITEFIGRILSITASGRILIVTMPCVCLARFLLGPILLPLKLLSNLFEKQEEEEKSTVEDEILSFVEQDKDSEEEGGDSELEDDERRMIRGIFDLDETPVHEIMTPRVDLDAVEERTSIEDVKKQFVESGFSRVPVYHRDIDNIIGIAYAKDLLDERRIRPDLPIKELVRPPIFTPETKNVGDLLTEFLQMNNHFAVVVDEYGGTAGVVTLEDIIEEIVGEIHDEYDHGEDKQGYEELNDGWHALDGRVTIAELNDLFDLKLSEDEDFDTIGGFVSARCGRIPEKGETFEFEGLKFEITEADQRRLSSLKIRKETDSESQEDK